MKIDFTNKKIQYYTIMFTFFAILLSIDRWTKQLAVNYLKDTDGKTLIPGVLKLVYVENRGAAFGILQGHRELFYFITTAFCIGIIYFFFKTPIEKKYYILSVFDTILFAGAIGNFIDRAFQGYVVDFIYFSLIDFPVFNVADICITGSMFILVLLFIFYFKEEDIDLIFKFK